MFERPNGRLSSALESETPAAIVFPVSHPVGISVIRCLGRSGVPVVGVDFKRDAAGLHSRYAAPLHMPGMYRDQQTFVQALLDLGKRFRTRPVLFLVDDADLIHSLQRREDLERFFRFPLSTWEVVEPIMDKGKLYRLCEKEGFPIPKTWWVESLADLDRQKSDLCFPCIVKPTFSDAFRESFGVKAKRFEKFPDLRNFVGDAVHRKIEVVIQEWIPGAAGQLLTLGVYADAKSEARVVFTGRKIHQFPPDFGTARLAESLDCPEMVDLGRRFLKMMRYTGIGLLEFKKDADGSLKLLEMNPRPGGWVESLAAYCGANLVLAAYQGAVGEPVSAARSEKFGARWANLPEDFYYSLRGNRAFGYPDGALNFSTWLRLMKGLSVEAFMAWDDPVPALIRGWGLLKQLAAMEKGFRQVSQSRSRDAGPVVNALRASRGLCNG